MSVCVNWIALRLIFVVGLALFVLAMFDVLPEIFSHRVRALLRCRSLLALPQGKTLPERRRHGYREPIAGNS
jgi:hypothetical protein